MRTKRNLNDLVVVGYVQDGGAYGMVAIKDNAISAAMTVKSIGLSRDEGRGPFRWTLAIWVKSTGETVDGVDGANRMPDLEDVDKIYQAIDRWANNS